MKRFLIVLSIIILPLSIFGQSVPVSKILFPYPYNCEIKTQTPIQTKFLSKYSFGETVSDEILCKKNNVKYWKLAPHFKSYTDGNTERFLANSFFTFGGIEWSELYLYTVNSKIFDLTFITLGDVESFNILKDMFTKKYGNPNVIKDNISTIINEKKKNSGSLETTVIDKEIESILCWEDNNHRQIVLRSHVDKKESISRTLNLVTSEGCIIQLNYIDKSISKNIKVGIDEI